MSGDAGHLGGPQVDHPLVVGGVVGDVARAVLLLEAADAVLEAGGAGTAQGRARSLVAEVGPEGPGAVLGRVVGLGGEGTSMSGRSVDVGEPPGLGAVGQVAVGEEEDRRPVLDGDADRLDGRLEAVRGRHGGHDGHGRLAVAAVHGVEEVGLLGLGGQSGRGSAALDVDDEQRQLEETARPIVSDLRSMPGTAGGGDPEGPAEGGPDGGADAGDLVLGLEGADPEVLVLGQLVEDVRGRGDRVGAEEEGSLASWAAAISPQARAVLPVTLV
jgi:hypothetical protein